MNITKTEAGVTTPKKQIVQGCSNRDLGLVSGVVAAGAGLFTLMRATDKSVASSLKKEADAAFNSALKSGKKVSEMSEEIFIKSGAARRISKGSTKHIIFGTALTAAAALFAKFCYDNA